MLRKTRMRNMTIIQSRCADCGIPITLIKETVILNLLECVLGYLPAHEYLCPDCWWNQ